MPNRFMWYWCDLCQHKIVPHTHTHTHTVSSPVSLLIGAFSSCINPPSPYRFVHFIPSLSHSANISVCTCQWDSMTWDKFLFFPPANTSGLSLLSHQPHKSNYGNVHTFISLEGLHTPLWIKGLLWTDESADGEDGRPWESDWDINRPVQSQVILFFDQFICRLF